MVWRGGLQESGCRLFGLVLVLFRAQKIDNGLRLQDMFQAFLSAVLALGAVAEHATAPSSFMLVSGATSVQETCLVASESVGAMLEPCAGAASKLDGREIWSLAPDGSLSSSGLTKCLGSADGKKLGLFACNGLPSDSKWELQGNGQIKLASSNICLSQSGLAPGLTDAARSASVIASSTLDAAHGEADRGRPCFHILGIKAR